MFRRCALSLAILALSLAGCASVEQQSAANFKAPQGNYKLVVMRPDVAVSTVTAGGQHEQRADWTTTARDHVIESLRDLQSKRGGTTQIVMTPADAGVDEATLLDLERLHSAVGESILLFKFTSMMQLPTKKDVFDWTLGELATGYGAKSGYDYALFLYARDSFSSGGRQALSALSYLGCALGPFVACFVNPAGGRQVAFASLVDLKTGNVVWFNTLHSPVGDIRTPEGAEKLVKLLLDPMTPETPVPGKKS